MIWPDVRCEFCGAAAGDPCWNQSDEPMARCHRERRERGTQVARTRAADAELREKLGRSLTEREINALQSMTTGSLSGWTKPYAGTYGETVEYRICRALVRLALRLSALPVDPGTEGT